MEENGNVLVITTDKNDNKSLSGFNAVENSGENKCIFENNLSNSVPLILLNNEVQNVDQNDKNWQRTPEEFNPKNSPTSETLSEADKTQNLSELYKENSNFEISDENIRNFVTSDADVDSIPDVNCFIDLPIKKPTSPVYKDPMRDSLMSNSDDEDLENIDKDIDGDISTLIGGTTDNSLDLELDLWEGQFEFTTLATSPPNYDYLHTASSNITNNNGVTFYKDLVKSVSLQPDILITHLKVN